MIKIPNWCTNVMYLIGREEDVQAASLRYRTNKTVLSFERVIPTPADLCHFDDKGCTKLTEDNKLENLVKYGYPDWYEWRVATWGTKWDLDPTFVEPVRAEEEDLVFLIYTFDTAWSPPDGIARVISEQNPDILVVLVFDEPGCDFSGKHTYQNGEFVDRVDMASVAYITGLLNGDTGSLYYEFTTYFPEGEETENAIHQN